MLTNINDSFFDGIYKDIWRSLIPENFTQREVAYLIKRFDLTSNSLVLDLMCGFGRHAVSLATQGVSVIAVDNLKQYTEPLQDLARREAISLDVIQANVISLQPFNGVDLVMCMGNSLNFFSKSEVLTLLRFIKKSLRPNGYFIFNSWTLAEIVPLTFVTTTESRVDDVTMSTVSELQLNPSRIVTKSSFCTSDGVFETKEGIDYIYSLNELASLLEKEGFLLLSVEETPGKRNFALGDKRAYLIAQAIGS